jgi:ribosomal protein L5
MFFINKLNSPDIDLKCLLAPNQSLSFLEKIIVAVHLKDILKINDYIILQSICLLDTITGQKPYLCISKYRFNLGTKSFTFSCKVTLRKRLAYNFLNLLNTIIFSELKKRHVSCEYYLNNKNDLTFSFSTINVFTKLDEFYFN